MIEYTEKQLKSMSLSELTIIHNNQTANKVASFGSKTAAIKAILKKLKVTTTLAQSSNKKAKKRTYRPGIGIFVRRCLQSELSTKEILSAIKRKFPQASTTARNIDFYRYQLNKER